MRDERDVPRRILSLHAHGLATTGQVGSASAGWTWSIGCRRRNGIIELAEERHEGRRKSCLLLVGHCFVPLAHGPIADMRGVDLGHPIKHVFTGLADAPLRAKQR